MIKVTFYSEDGNNKQITVRMNSIKTYDKFINEYKTIGGFNHFESDLWGSIGKKESGNLLFIPANNRGFEMIYQCLYGESPYKKYSSNQRNKPSLFMGY